MLEYSTTYRTNHETLESFLKVIPAIHAMLPDLSIGVTNKTEWLAYFPGRKINLGTKPGRKIDPNEPLMDCIRYKKVLRQEVPPEFFGVAFTGLAAPILDGNEVVGAIAIQLQEQSEKELRRIADQIFLSLSQANERIGSISAGADGLAKISNTLLEQSKHATEGMKDTDEVIKFIKNIADKTNILGLNASIEAARAGESGRGFKIVAQEIRKLSLETVTSTEKISETLRKMHVSIGEISSLVEKVVTVGREQALSTEEISSFIDEIEKMSKDLKKYASEL